MWEGAIALEEDIPGETLAQLVAEEAPSAKYIQVSETNIQEISEPNHLLSRSSDGSGGVVKEKRQSFIFWSTDTVHNCSNDLLINVQKTFLNKMTENDTTTNSGDDSTTTLHISDPPCNISFFSFSSQLAS